MAFLAKENILTRGISSVTCFLPRLNICTPCFFSQGVLLTAPTKTMAFLPFFLSGRFCDAFFWAAGAMGAAGEVRTH